MSATGHNRTCRGARHWVRLVAHCGSRIPVPGNGGSRYIDVRPLSVARVEPGAGVADFERIHKEYPSRLPHVARIRSIFVMRTIYKSNGVEL